MTENGDNTGPVGRGVGRRGFLIGAAALAAAPVASRADLGSPTVKLAPNQSAKALPCGVFETPRHRTAFLEAGPAGGPLMVFLHGWPHLGLCWRSQIQHFAAAGWHCIAPDLRGYGGSSIPTRVEDYGVREVVADMTELHDALGGKPAVWVGHSLGCTIAWAMATHHPERCRGIIALTVPYLARGNALQNLTPLVDRAIYPVDRYPVGQWDYMLFCHQHFSKAVRDFEANAPRVLDMFYAPGSPQAVNKPTPLASISAKGGWFPPGSTTRPVQQGDALLPADDRKKMLAAFAQTGFSGPCAWYLNDAANMAFATEAPEYGRISLPALFLGGQWDAVCDTAYGRLAEPMREDCSDLTEISLPAGHMLMLEQPDEVNSRIASWLAAKRQSPAVEAH